MMFSPKEQFQTEPARFIEEAIKAFARTSPLNHMPIGENQLIFDESLVQFADGDDPVFAEYKTVVAPIHLTPREALTKTFDKNSMPVHLSVVSWILPFASRVRESNRRHKLTPSLLWSNAYFFGEKFNNALREYVVELLTKMEYLAVAPTRQPYFQVNTNEKGRYSNWSERHIAYAAGLGTFSLSDGFITECGIAHRCGSVVTDLALPVSPRAAINPYANCLFYAGINCRTCIIRCPAGAITENGHDKIKCRDYSHTKLYYLREKRNLGGIGCGLCQTKVPCEFRNPTQNLKKRAR